jgi:hypothetical protein
MVTCGAWAYGSGTEADERGRLGNPGMTHLARCHPTIHHGTDKHET